MFGNGKVERCLWSEAKARRCDVRLCNAKAKWSDVRSCNSKALYGIVGRSKGEVRRC